MTAADSHHPDICESQKVRQESGSSAGAWIAKLGLFYAESVKATAGRRPNDQRRPELDVLNGHFLRLSAVEYSDSAGRSYWDHSAT